MFRPIFGRNPPENVPGTFLSALKQPDSCFEGNKSAQCVTMSYIINDVIHYIKQCIHETEVLTIMKGDVIPYEKVMSFLMKR